MNLSPHFTLSELTRTSQPLGNTPIDDQIEALTVLCENVLEPVRDLLGVPLRINSAFRSVAVNVAIGGARSSQHMKGEAADVRPVGMSAEDAMRAIVASDIPFDQAIIYAGGFIHLSHSRHGNRRQALRSSAKGGSGGPYAPYATPA